MNGCTDPAAFNYNTSANVDDGSCTYPCLDNEISFNMYDSFGDGWNGSTYTIIDASGAVVDSGGLLSGFFATDVLCLLDGCYSLDITTNPFPSEVSWLLADANGDTISFGGVGTYQVTIGTVLCITGCTDSLGCNYDPNAAFDDGLCDYNSCYGCTDPLAENYDILATADNGYCIYLSLIHI